MVDVQLSTFVVITQSVGTTLADICYKMFCWGPVLPHVCSTKSPAALGTSCGPNKVEISNFDTLHCNVYFLLLFLFIIHLMKAILINVLCIDQHDKGMFSSSAFSVAKLVDSF